MIGGLCTKIEDQLGLVVTRLCRVFYNKSHSHDKYKKFCCIPTFILVILIFIMMLAIGVFFRIRGFDIKNFSVEEQAFITTFCFIVILSVIGSSNTWLKIFWNLMRSPKSRIRNIHINHSRKNSAHDPKSESFIFKLKREVDLIAHTVKTIDSFSHSCTRLVIIIDGLDSCEQSKVVQILEIIHVLFTREGDPFISVLAVDPHVLIKGIEGNLTAAFRNGSVNGNDYLRTIIHLPVFLQVDLSRAKALSKLPTAQKKFNNSVI
jgi:ankyrin repeat-rich membrane spanning protein